MNNLKIINKSEIKRNKQLNNMINELNNESDNFINEQINKIEYYSNNENNYFNNINQNIKEEIYKINCINNDMIENCNKKYSGLYNEVSQIKNDINIYNNKVNIDRKCFKDTLCGIFSEQIEKLENIKE